jgi:hypothetical protein
MGCIFQLEFLMARNALGAMWLRKSFVPQLILERFDLNNTIGAEDMLSAPDHIPMCPCSWYVIQPLGRVLYVLEERIGEADAIPGCCSYKKL